MKPYRVTPPAGVLVPVADLRDELNLETGERDARLASYEAAAVGWLDGYAGHLGRCLLAQQWAIPLTDGAEVVDLPFPDGRNAVVQITDGETWSDLTGVTVAACDQRITLTDLPDDRSNLRLLFDAGFGAADDVPEPIRQVVRMLVCHWYLNPAASTKAGAGVEALPFGVEALLAPWRMIFVGA